MTIGGTRVGQTRDDLGRWVALAVRRIVDSDGVLVVTNADVAAVVTLVGPVVVHALGVMDVTILGSTARRLGVLRVGEVDVLEARCTSLVARLSTNRNGIIIVPIDDDVVRATDWERIRKETNKVLGRVEGDRVFGIDCQEFVHIEDLHDR